VIGKENRVLTPLEKARETVLSHLPGPRVEQVPIMRAAGRYLAADLLADRDLPPADRSAMDGYALRAADVSTVPVVLRLVGEVAAGSDSRPVVEPSTCVKIFTGANVPPGADAVAVVEETEPEDGGRVRFLGSVACGANIRRQGEDAPSGALLLARGTWLGGSQISTCAACGADPVAVHAVPRLAVVSTGAELRDVADPVQAHEIRNSNGPALIAALHQLGLEDAVDLGSVPDVTDGIRARLQEALDRCDAVVMTGGVSRGDYDLVPDAAQAAGCTIRLHGVRMKPGKPFLFATSPSGQPVFGLPGNPLSVLATFWEMVAPALLSMMGDPAPDVWRVPARLTREVRIRGERTVLLPVHLGPGSAGEGFEATPVRDRSSADLAAAGRANGTVRLEPETRSYRAGTIVEAHPWARPL
jgi:molybdenum cofactor synthesis domain-containing protein